MVKLALLGAGMLVVWWALVVILAGRLSPGTLKELARLLPACFILVRRMRRDHRYLVRAK